MKTGSWIYSRNRRVIHDYLTLCRGHLDAPCCKEQEQEQLTTEYTEDTEPPRPALQYEGLKLVCAKVPGSLWDVHVVKI